MRIHIPLSPSLLTEDPSKRCADPLMVKIGGDLVLMELQGELDCEGDSAGQVIGILGLARMDKPTLHLGAHHLLHGKISNLPRPLAVIRPAGLESDESDAEDEDSGDEDDPGKLARQPGATPDNSKLAPPNPSSLGPSPTPTRPTASSSALPTRLLPQSSPVHDSPTASRSQFGDVFSSSPVGPPSQARDYSSDLSSPVRDDDGGNHETPVRMGKRKRKDQHRARKTGGQKGDRVPRTREYEVVGLIRKKVVFALRPEPIVHATALPD